MHIIILGGEELMENNTNNEEVLGEIKMKNYHIELLPFGIRYRESAQVLKADGRETVTSATVTLLPVPDTDPPDTDTSH